MRIRKLFFENPLLPSVAMGTLFSLALFSLMYSVIRVGHHKAAQMEPLQTIDFVRLKRDSAVETLQRNKPPPPPAQPPPPPKMRVAAESVQQEGMSGMAIPTLNLSANVGGGPVGGKMGSGTAGMFDGELMPLQTIQPAYPRDAARAGITGWVQVEFLVSADGSVRSARAVDAKPKGVFEAAAITAALRWKFKPKIVDGKPVDQRGTRKIDFSLNAPSSS